MSYPAPGTYTLGVEVNGHRSIVLWGKLGGHPILQTTLYTEGHCNLQQILDRLNVFPELLGACETIADILADTYGAQMPAELAVPLVALDNAIAKAIAQEAT